MSLMLLYDVVQKTVWDKKRKDFVQKEYLAFCTSVACLTAATHLKRGRPNPEAYDPFKRVKKDVPGHKTSCPDCENVLVWEEGPVVSL